MPPVPGRHWLRRRRIDGPVLELAFAPTVAVALVAGLAVELRCSRRAVRRVRARRWTGAPPGSCPLLQLRSESTGGWPCWRVDDPLSDRALALARHRVSVLAAARLLPRSALATRPRHPHRHRRRASPARPCDRRGWRLSRASKPLVAQGNSVLRHIPRGVRSRTRPRLGRRRNPFPATAFAEEAEWLTPELRAHRATAAARRRRGRRGMRLRAPARPRRSHRSTGRR